ncbi:hypothetical protein B0H16DRAFT_1330407 [Mycena metata]|uniref:Transmembrane protein n=1 Tax=Mycena metata TaxID=1033252 RepID=A0AAD7HW34_9AGAR|nr:hypothetical protein B0H16DRAFT_1330407 [Mycena metata]
MPSLGYPVTRDFPGQVFAPAAFTGAIIALVFLVIINAASAGYETVSEFNADFNVTRTHWFNQHLPFLVPKPGTLCDPRLLGLGDTITTNYTLFQYTIASIDLPNIDGSGLSYRGWTLDNCDITSLFVNADANTFVMDFTALVSCRADEAQILTGNDYQITARTDWQESTLSGKYTSLLGAQKALKDRQGGTFNKTKDARGTVLDAITAVASTDFAIRVLNLDAVTSFPSIISFQADFPWCPASLADAPCASQIPPYTAGQAPQQYFASQPAASFNQPLVTDNTSAIISNLVQGIYATVRMDLGNRSPNNFLLNTSRIPEAINATFPSTFPNVANRSLLYSLLVDDGYYASTPGTSSVYDLTGLLPLTLPGPAVLDGVYLCRFLVARSPGAAFIAVVAATLSVFSSGWAAFLAVAAAVVKRRSPGGK